MLQFLCSLGLASCITAPLNGGYQTVYTPDGYLLTNNQGIEFYTTTPPGPFVPVRLTVVRTSHGVHTDVLYPAGTHFYAPNLRSKLSD
jgi:hypothetical protein